MKKQITRISPIQTAKILALLMFFTSLLMILIMALPMSMSFGSNQKFPFGFLFLVPFFQAIACFIFASFGAWVYNLLASRIGGIEFNSEQVDE